MTKKKPRGAPSAEALDAMARVTVGAAALAITSEAAAPATAVVLSAALAAVVEGLLGQYSQRHRRRIDAWWESLVTGATGASPEEVAAAVDARRDNPDVQQVVYNSVRALADALDDAVIPALAALGRDYFDRKAAADGFFRGLMDLLCVLTASELDSLRVLAAAVEKCGNPRPTLRVGTERNGMGSTIDLLERSAVGEAVVVTARWIDFGGTDQAHTRHGEPLGDIRHVHRLFPLLKAHGLGMEPSTGHHWQEGGTCVVEVRRETMARIAAIVGPPGRLQPAR